jgi:hypothetical protein
MDVWYRFMITYLSVMDLFTLHMHCSVHFIFVLHLLLRIVDYL